GDGQWIDAVTGPAPGFWRAHHAVERHGRIEPTDGGGLQHVVAAHTEAEHRHACDVVVDHEAIGGRRQELHLLRVVEVLDVGEASLDRRSHRLRLGCERLDDTDREPVRRHSPGHVLEQWPQPTDVRVQHNARDGQTVVPRVHGHDLETVDDEWAG